MTGSPQRRAQTVTCSSAGRRAAGRSSPPRCSPRLRGSPTQCCLHFRTRTCPQSLLSNAAGRALAATRRTSHSPSRRSPRLSHPPSWAGASTPASRSRRAVWERPLDGPPIPEDLPPRARLHRARVLGASSHGRREERLRLVYRAPEGASCPDEASFHNGRRAPEPRHQHLRVRRREVRISRFPGFSRSGLQSKARCPSRGRLSSSTGPRCGLRPPSPPAQGSRSSSFSVTDPRRWDKPPRSDPFNRDSSAGVCALPRPLRDRCSSALHAHPPSSPPFRTRCPPLARRGSLATEFSVTPPRRTAKPRRSTRRPENRDTGREGASRGARARDGSVRRTLWDGEAPARRTRGG